MHRRTPPRGKPEALTRRGAELPLRSPIATRLAGTWLQIGDVISGKYRLVRLLGDGGMGSVYEATHELLGTRVAIKVLHADLARRTRARRPLPPGGARRARRSRAPTSSG